MNTGNGKRQNSTFSPTQTSAGSPPPPGYRPGGVAGDPTALPFRPQAPPGRRLPATAPTAGPAAMLGAAGQTPRASPPPLPPGALRGLCAWLDGLPLSRPKRHLARDFSDGVMLAEIVKHFRPRLVDLHNYVPTCNTDQKLSNWSILNRKVFHKLRLWVSETDIRKVVANTPGAIEPILCAVREKVTDGAAHQYLLDPAGPGPSGGIADRPRAELTASPHTGLPGPTAPSSAKTPQSPRTPEKTGRCVCTGWDPAGGPWGHLDSRVQQLLEEKEQAVALLQEMVKILQMKVVRLEHLVRLKDQRIGELTRAGGEPQ
ncbi:sperm flagellar protein 1-like isoform X3 [Lynx canadensis]|uniref:sperm flagellar protein 1-like isoform X3 n=1 Tax=Lynx canadensis TaxID=61383 RepID=UPI0011B091AB|nr:sperm flagellar protein 1-like isoform X3 [Lynx canadensis]